MANGIETVKSDVAKAAAEVKQADASALAAVNKEQAWVAAHPKTAGWLLVVLAVGCVAAAVWGLTR